MTAAVIVQSNGAGRGFAVLFFGGRFIHPISNLLCRKVFGRLKEAAGNPLAGAALESILAMIGGLIAAWLSPEEEHSTSASRVGVWIVPLHA
ncbi:hypothetical protein JQK15_21370 [Sphingobium sp. BHU LFT2]|uniref:hypothetical protein n=1 Tax=Sphingobium sp. BHU LFT2 TaxID=2807634 RepID=UPI001BEB8EA8|nr:hypothetical protein [Sphingobium sp. BHU LFT2]MBT2246061.1 hypothetical protein [Sphingobium sp. BHU LFT2]